MTKHNKKRNVGIVYELLLQRVSKALIESNKKEAKKVTKIIEKHFKKGTELYKEFRLFNALAKSKISNTHTVASILNEAKIASNKLDEAKLEKEKSNLIRNINYTLGKDFYYEEIKNYRDLGTIQMALNEWRKEDKDIRRLIDLETKVGEIMLRENKALESASLDASHADKLVLKIMTEKFNQHYGELTSDQKLIIKNYVFFSGKDNQFLKEFFDNKQKEVLVSLDTFEDNSDNKYLLKKVDQVRHKINEIKTTEIKDDTVVKFLSITKLIEELEKGV